MAKNEVSIIVTAKDNASKVMSNIGGQLQTLARRAAVAASAIGTATAVIGVKTAADLETARMGFVTLLGSAQDADRVMSRIKEESKRTPFEIPGLTQATQLLTAVTKDGDQAIEILLDVGESLAAMGKGQEELDRIIVNLQQIGAVGHASMLDIKQFAFAGIPIFEMLEKQTGKTGEALSNMISDGEITFELLTDMFKQATDEGGRFAGAFENQSGTFNQSVSNMKDSFSIFAADFMVKTGAFDFAKKTIASFSQTLTDNTDAIIAVVTSVVNRLKEYGQQAIELGQAIARYLEPKLKALFNTIKEDLIPVFMRLWQEVIKPLLPVIGTALVIAIGAAVDVLNLLLTILTPVINVLIDMKEAVLIGVTAFVAFRAAIMISNLIYGVSAAITAMNASLVASSVAAGGARLAMSSMMVTMIGSAGLVAAFAAVGAMAVLQVGRAIKAFFDLRKETQAAKDAVVSLDNAIANIDPSLERAVREGRMTREEAGRRRIQQRQSLGLSGLDNAPQFATGGFTGIGGKYDVAGVVHKGEYVVPREQVNQATGEPMLGNTININGNITLSTPSAADRFFERLNQSQLLASKGMS